MPTGIVVQCQNERSQHKNRASAMKQLRAKLYEYEMEKKRKADAKAGRTKLEINFGSQIRSYVLAPYRMIKDHRTKLSIGDVDRVLDGDIDADPCLSGVAQDRPHCRRQLKTICRTELQWIDANCACRRDHPERRPGRVSDRNCLRAGRECAGCGCRARIYAAKKRPFASPLIVHVADEAMARALTESWPAIAGTLAQTILAGTVDAGSEEGCHCSGHRDRGSRFGGHSHARASVALALIRAGGCSDCRPQRESIHRDLAHHRAACFESLGDAVDLILDGGPTQVGIESTVVSLRRNPPVFCGPA